MTKRIFIHSFVGILWLICPVASNAAVGGKITRELIEQTLELAAKRSGRELAEQGARQASTESLERLTRAYGDDVLKAVEEGGLELLEGVAHHGDAVMETALKVSPAARRALARDVSTMLPLAQRHGVGILELEARAPGFATRVLATFGDDTGMAVAKSVPTEDLPRLLAYADKADAPATKVLLVEAYEKEGKSLFERIPPKIVLASGLSAAMLHGTHRLTAPPVAVAESIRENPDVAEATVNRGMAWAGSIVLVMLLALLWRFRLMPWHNSKPRSQEVSGRSNSDEQSSKSTLGGDSDGNASQPKM